MANRHDVIIWDDSECPVEKDDVCWKNRLTRFGKLKRIIGVYYVEESATAVQCRVKSKCGKNGDWSVLSWLARRNTGYMFD